MRLIFSFVIYNLSYMSFLAGRGRRIAVIAVLGLGACGPASEDDGTTGSDGTGADDGDTTMAPATTSPGSSGEPGDTTAGEDESTDGTTSAATGDVCGEQTGGAECDCDTFAQDCPDGMKCMPWADDGGATWNALRCSPVVDEPAGLDEPCTVEDGPASGLDTCDVGLMCWDVDLDSLEGTCIALCGGSATEPTCQAGSTCETGAAGPSFGLCLTVCNPLADDCDEGEQCVPIDADFRCVAEARDPLGYGEPCESLVECGSGLVCVNEEFSPCDGEPCCTAFCDVSDGDPNPACPDAASGQICTPWYEDEPPDGFENLGVCVEGGQ